MINFFLNVYKKCPKRILISPSSCRHYKRKQDCNRDHIYAEQGCRIKGSFRELLPEMYLNLCKSLYSNLFQMQLRHYFGFYTVGF